MIEQRPTSQDERAIIEASTLEESIERAERIAGVKTLFRRGMDRITQPAGFNDYIHSQARFPEQPFFNVLLLLEQMPDATKIASGLHWDAVSRPPLSAERGIWLFVPYEREIGVDGTNASIRELIGVGVETVYDVSQTRGPIYQEEQRWPISAAEVQERIVRRMIGRLGNRGEQEKRSVSERQTTLPSGQLGLGLNFGTTPKEGTGSGLERLPTLKEVLRERLIQRGRLPAAEIEPIAGVVATILMIRYGVELGDVWMPDILNMIDTWSPVEPHFSEVQQLLASV